MRGARLIILCLASLATSIVAAQDGAPAYEHTICTSDHVESYHFAPCFLGEAGPLSQAERDALLDQLRAAAAADFMRVEHDVTRAVFSPDRASRIAIADILVGRGGLPAGAAAMLADLDGAEAALGRALRRESTEVRSLRVGFCRLDAAGSDASHLEIECENMIGCARGCYDLFAYARLTVRPRGWQLVDAGTAERPSGGMCGCCMDVF